MNDVKPGNVVFLKSGGPMMSVYGVTDRGEVDCTWFETVSNCTNIDGEPEYGPLRKNQFAAATLIVCEE